MENINALKSSNNPLKCLIVDDEWVAIKIIAGNIEKLDFLIVEDTCSSAIEAADILKRKEIDLMFLDINMPYLSGLDFLESLDKAPLTIITTAYSEYALDGFRLHVVDYLLKPFPFQRFFRAAQIAFDRFNSRVSLQSGADDKSDVLYIRQGDSFQKIKWGELLFVETMQNYLKLHFRGKTFVIHQTMASLEELLPKDIFFRTHKSYLVNTAHIDRVCGGRLFIEGKEIPISKHRKEDFLNTVIYKKLASK